MQRLRVVSAVGAQVARVALPIAATLALATALICWLARWRTWTQYAAGLQYAALAAFILGGFGLLAGSGMGRARAMIPRPDYVKALYDHRSQQLDRATYEFLIGAMVAITLFLISRLVFGYAA
jgi:hypothetical protein